VECGACRAATVQPNEALSEAHKQNMRTLLALICFVIVAGCDPVSEKPPVSTQSPPIAHDGPKIVPNHIGSPEWNEAHQSPNVKPQPIPVQPVPGERARPIPVKPDPRVKLHPAHTH